ncbi:9120_t:CDS:2 [Paraglomus brasilianum]|uniref:9120_t:CDS:1 n=1 Tax=Paraglomus brasilianum TaxID=144538 RepID=A0A9N9FHX9_9GLOM|nr:9120_t:CDS:2 [Paraglomus brasilianum]
MAPSQQHLPEVIEKLPPMPNKSYKPDALIIMFNSGNDNNSNNIPTIDNTDHNEDNSNRDGNRSINDGDWVAKVPHQILELPSTPPINLESLIFQRYIINENGWWPLFGGDRRRKRNHSASSSSLYLSKHSRRNASTSPFAKRRKIHNSPHFSSPFSIKNYLAVEWSKEENKSRVAPPPKTTTSALPQENFAAVTSRVLLVRRLKARQGLLKGDAASRFRKNLLLKVAHAIAYAKLASQSESIDASNDVFIKRPWRDGTTEPQSGSLTELAQSRQFGGQESGWGQDKLVAAREALSHAMLQDFYYIVKDENPLMALEYLWGADAI